MPHALTDRDRRLRLEFAHELLAQVAHDPRCLNWVVTTDKCWFYQYDPRCKECNKEWLHKDEDRGQVVCRERSVKKVMLVPFFDSRGLLHWEYFHNQNITKEVFLGVVQCARERIRIRRGAQVWHNRDEYVLHMDNAPTHRSLLVRGYLRQENWNVMKHPPYSPYLSPADFFLFPQLKKKIKGYLYPSIEALVVTIEFELELQQNGANASRSGWTDADVAYCSKETTLKGCGKFHRDSQIWTFFDSVQNVNNNMDNLS